MTCPVNAAKYALIDAGTGNPFFDPAWDAWLEHRKSCAECSKPHWAFVSERKEWENYGQE